MKHVIPTSPYNIIILDDRNDDLAALVESLKDYIAFLNKVIKRNKRNDLMPLSKALKMHSRRNEELIAYFTE